MIKRLLLLLTATGAAALSVQPRGADRATTTAGAAATTTAAAATTTTTATATATATAAATTAAAATWPPAGADPDARWIEGGSSGPLGPLLDRLLEQKFRSALAAEAGGDVPDAGFSGIVALSRALVSRHRSGSAIAGASRRVLRSLFPNWPPGAPTGQVGLLYWFGVLFARPFPVFSAQLNAWVTWWAAQWLMGPCTLERLDDKDRIMADTPTDGHNQQVLVRRCRFLEESRCASVCVNACKMPTQAFFNEEMGVPMRMVPDYETLQCRFQFGLPPTEDDEADARATPCFSVCPAAVRTVSVVESTAAGAAAGAAASAAESAAESSAAGESCSRMNSDAGEVYP